MRYKMKTLDEVKSQIENLANKVDVPADMLPSFGNFAESAYSYVYIEGHKYHWVVSGNSPSKTDVATTDSEELFYFVFQTLTEQMGLVYEILNRNPIWDYRRLAYSHQLEMLQKLNPQWKARRGKEIEESLKWYPYKDNG